MLFRSIPEMGLIMAHSLVDFFAQPKIKLMIDEFKKLGVKLKGEQSNTDGKLKGKSFVFTGGLISFSRAKAKEIITRQSGQWIDSLSRKTDFLVVGKNPGSKFAKAQKLGVKIIDEAEFKKLIGLG